MQLVFWGFTLPTQVEYINQLIKEYTAQHPNVSIQVDNVSYTDLEKKLLVAMGTGTGPDMFAINIGWLPPYFEKNNLAAISPQALNYASLDALKEAYLPGTVDPFVKDGKLFALPYYLNTVSLFLNSNDFKEAGLDPDKDYPKTWDQVVEVGKKLTKVEGGKITRQGFRFTFVNPVWTQFIFEPLINQAGGATLGPDGKCAMNSPAGVKAMDILASFVRQKVMDPNLSVATAPLPTLDIAKGVTSMETGHPLTVDFIRTNNPAMWESKSFKVVPFPQIDPSKRVTLLSGNVFAINGAASADKVAVAQDFTRHLVSRPADWLTKVAAVAPVKALANTAEAKAFPYLDVIMDDMKYGRVTTWSKNAPDVVAAEHRALEAVVLNNVNSKQALDQACQEVNRALGS
ncbi:MAG: extracellular solute-binding protein [Gemmataceae bacterium]|nr:extracellular solute-binding protein [Gemmataceae bacterium]